MPSDDVATRLDLVIHEFMRMIVDTEAQQRTMLKLSLTADPVERSQLPLRQGRAIKWIEDALELLLVDGLMSAADVHRLALAIRSASGIEALAWLTDIGGLSHAEAVDLMRWSARAMLQSRWPQTLRTCDRYRPVRAVGVSGWRAVAETLPNW